MARIDEIAKQYMLDKDYEYLMIDDLNSFHDIYSEYEKQPHYRKPRNIRGNCVHPLDVLHAVSRALARSPLFKVLGKVPTHRGCLNMYVLK